MKIDNIHKTNSSSEGNTSNSEESQQVTQQTTTTPTNKYIGKVIISDRAKHNKFYVCVTKDENIEVPHFYRVVAESFYTFASVRNLTYSRGGACPTDRGSTPYRGTPLN